MQTLSQYLDAEKISQVQFAALVGVTQPAVSKWLTEGAAPSRKMMAKINEVTNGKVPIASWFPAREQERGAA